MSGIRPSTDNVGVYALDVGQGDCSFVVGPHGEIAPILIDCADADVALNFVSDHQMSSLHAIVVSHLDDDHIRGLLEFIKSFFASNGSIESVFICTDRPGPSATSRALIAGLLDWESQGKLAIAPAFRENEGPTRTVHAAADWSVEIVLPFYSGVLREQSQRGSAPNMTSAVVRTVVGSRAILIGADAPLASLERLPAANLKADVVRTPHHGGRLDERRSTLTIGELYQRIGAETAVISVGSANRFGHPIKEHVVAARQSGSCRVLCTQLTQQCAPGWFSATGARSTKRLADRLVTQLGEVEYPYRHRGRGRRKEFPCAGSVVTSLFFDGRVEVLPQPGDWHERFVSKLGSPLCR